LSFDTAHTAHTKSYAEHGLYGPVGHPSVPSSAHRCGWFAAERRADRRYRSTAAADAGARPAAAAPQHSKLRCRGVVVRERGGTPFRQIFWSRNGAPANIVGHR